MPVDNLKDFSYQWIMFGLLFTCLIGFSITFVYNNNANALGDSGTIYEELGNNMTSNLVSVEGTGNSFMNVTSFTDPEASYLGSRDSTATAYGITGSSKSFFSTAKIFIAWVFSGSIGEMLVVVFGGMFTFGALYFITKWFRIGG